jgi:hypothetical protein
MLPLMATLSIEPDRCDRRSARRTLRIEVESSAGADGCRTYILNLSETGLLLESQSDLETGDSIAVELPGSGNAIARVVWTNGSFAGCEFAAPLSTATVSAALLLAPFEPEPPVQAADWPDHDLLAQRTRLRPMPDSARHARGFAVLAGLLLAAFLVLAGLYVLLALPS